jgi:hypothetical protein
MRSPGAAKAFEEKFQECGTGQTMLSFVEDGVWRVSGWSLRGLAWVKMVASGVTAQLT